MVTLHQCVHCNHYNHRATVAIEYDKGFPKSSMQRMHKEDTWRAKEQPVYKAPIKTRQEAFDKAGKMERNAPW